MQYCEIKKLKGNAKGEAWWKNITAGDGNSWKTLQHNGVQFPPSYEPLPASVKIKYNGEPIGLNAKNTDNKFHVSAEEAAVFYAMKLEQDDRLAEKNKNRKKAKDDAVFVKNFWEDWKSILGKNSVIKDFKKVDFKPIQKYIAKRSEEKKAAKKALSKEEKKAEKDEKEELKDLYGYAVIDGVKIAIGNYVVQPPGLYIGHGEQPLRGKIKGRIVPGDIILNVSKKFVPKCRIEDTPCKWGGVVEEKDKTWIASYKHPITGELTYVWLKREESHFVCSDDMQKFNKARMLEKNIEKIRKKYTKDFASDDETTQELAVAVYFLDILAIRPGTDKDETKEAGTLGLTTLKCSNIKFEGADTVTIDFIGKSSIKFVKTFKVNKTVYKILKNSCKKGVSSKIFPDINANTLNAYLKSLLPDLTAKVFRTWKASSILQRELNQNIPSSKAETHEKKIIYDRVNMEVAKELNHKKLSGDDSRVKKIKEKIKEFEEKKKEATPAKKKSIQKSIELHKSKLEEATHNISTSTSKVNYLDPRITVSWCKKAEMPIEKIYNKGTLKKFIWAMDTESTWQF